MKTRTGFVSNSSTTSFMVVVRKDATSSQLDTIDYVCRALSCKDDFIARSPVSDYIKDKTALLKESKQNRLFLEKEIVILQEVLQDKNAMELLARVWSVFYQRLQERPTSQAAVTQWRKHGMKKPKEEVEFKISLIRGAIDRFKCQEESLQKRISELKAYADWELLSFEEDAMGRGFLSGLVKDLEKTKDVVVIESKTT